MADLLEEELRATAAPAKEGSVAKDLFAGAVGGVAQVLIGTSVFSSSFINGLK
jgi:hypothetical protein